MQFSRILGAVGFLLVTGLGFFLGFIYPNFGLVIFIFGFFCWLVYMIYDIHQHVEIDSEILHHLPETKNLIGRAVRIGAVVPPGFFKRSKIDFDKLD